MKTVIITVASCLLPIHKEAFAFVRPHQLHEVKKYGPTKTTRSLATASNPRTGFAQWLLDVALESPIWKHVLVPQARQKIISTAEDNGIEWNNCKEWLYAQAGPWRRDPLNDDDAGELQQQHPTSDIPDYYQKPFHAYSEGNLCWNAALEVEIAAAAVGARNFPAYGRDGETAFRESFGAALVESGAKIPDRKAVIVDLGCGTGMSTRWLARKYPEPSHRFIGIDLSHYFLEVGKRLLELSPKARQDGGTWVSTIERDPRIQYQWGDATNTGFKDNSVDVVNLQFVAHECPFEITLEMIQEAYRILKPNGQLWFSEMDFEAPAYAAQRANPLLFSLIRSTEPYLDDYADHSFEIRAKLKSTFAHTIMSAATGRHFAIVATKGDAQNQKIEGVLEDLRFDDQGNYRVRDTHLKVWENKQ
jgi:ubiquinone/menaquinone biosynthesis C-methylase UbiE